MPTKRWPALEEHLAKGNGLKLDGMTYRLGRKLTIDAKTESFVERRRGQQAADPQVPQAVRGARQDRLVHRQ